MVLLLVVLTDRIKVAAETALQYLRPDEPLTAEIKAYLDMEEAVKKGVAAATVTKKQLQLPNNKTTAAEWNETWKKDSLEEDQDNIPLLPIASSSTAHSTIESTVEDTTSLLEVDVGQELQPTIPVHIVKQVSNVLLERATVPDQTDSSKYWLHELLNGTEIVYEKPPPVTRPPELVERLKKIKGKLDNEEYERMVRNVASCSDTGLASEIREVRQESKQITGIINALFSILGVFAGVYVLGSYIFPEPAYVIILYLLAPIL